MASPHTVHQLGRLLHYTTVRGMRMRRDTGPKLWTPIDVRQSSALVITFCDTPVNSRRVLAVVNRESIRAYLAILILSGREACMSPVHADLPVTWRGTGQRLRASV